MHYASILADPVAQSAERWTPRGESTRPGYNSPGSKCDGRLTFMSLLTGMVAVGGRPQPGEVSEGTGRVRLCAHVKTLDSKFCHRTRIARSEGRGQGHRNMLRLAGALSL